MVNCFAQKGVTKQLVEKKFSYRGHFPLMITVVEALFDIPVSNAWPEGGASNEHNVHQEQPAKPSEGRYAKFPDVYQLKWSTRLLQKIANKKSKIAWLAAKNCKKLLSFPTFAPVGSSMSRYTQPNMVPTHRVPKP